MKPYLIIITVIFGMIASSISAQEVKKKVAVYVTGDVEEAYKKVIGAKLVSSITTNPEFAAVERTTDFLAAISAEQDYQTSGEVRDSQIARLGQKFGVRYVVVADISELFDEIFISARLINVESGLVENAFDASGAVESMAQLSNLSADVTKGLITERKITIDKCSTKPKHLTLAASFNGKDYYVTPIEWNRISDDHKLLIEKKGICIFYNSSHAFVISLKQESVRGFSTSSTPYNLLKYISSNYSSIQDLMRIFEGSLPSDFPYLHEHSNFRIDEEKSNIYTKYASVTLFKINTGEEVYVDKKDLSLIFSYKLMGYFVAIE